MSKAMTINNGWQTRTASFSTRGSRTGRNNLGWEEAEDMTPEQERSCLVAKKIKLEAELLTYPKKHPERKRIGLEMNELNLRINEIRPALKCKGIEKYVMDVLRSDLTKPQFDQIMNKARRLRAKDETNT